MRVAENASAMIPFPPTPIILGNGHPFPIPVSDGKTVFDGAEYGSGNRSFDIDGAAARVVAAYDRDGSGGLDTNLETNRYSNGMERTIDRLAKYADAAGNHDGTATAKEIAAAIRRFDTNTTGASKGRLDGSERQAFLNVFGEDSRPIYFHHMPGPDSYRVDDPPWNHAIPVLDIGKVEFGPLHPYEPTPGNGPADARLAIKRDLSAEIRSKRD